jgi:hypothetical protein
MPTTLPPKVRDTLTTIGQVAAELPCRIEGYREFVTVFRYQTDRIMGFANQYPYLADCEVAFRVMRFRVDAELIADDRGCCNDDLIGLQCIHVATEGDVLSVLQIWHVSPENLRQPRETEVPV